MTSDIEDRMYELITKVENFKFAYDINERFDSIKERIIQEFWETLFLKIKEEFPEGNYTKFDLYEQAMGFSFQSYRDILFITGIENSKLYFGISVSHKGTKKRMQEVKDQFVDLFEIYEYDDEYKSSDFYNWANEDFDSHSGLNKILIDNRDVLIDKYTRDFKVVIKSIKKTFVDCEDDSQHLNHGVKIK